MSRRGIVMFCYNYSDVSLYIKLCNKLSRKSLVRCLTSFNSGNNNNWECSRRLPKGSLDNISRFLSTEPRIVGLDLFLAAPGLPQDGQKAGAVIFHMLLECLPQADTLGVAAPTH